ncbi:MAG TPA: sterol desaturase family protein, partial [Bacteroidia bacterium]|nr:sterol desaturase family protein [Bacteroidia bacterium]
LLDKVLVFIKPPGWLPSYLGGYQMPKEIDVHHYVKYDAHSVKSYHFYIFWQFVIVLAAATILLFKQSEFTFFQLIIFSVLIIFTLVNIGAILEGKKWAFFSENLRLILFTVSSL